MKQEPSKPGSASNSPGLGSVTGGAAQKRTREQAKRELAGEKDKDRQDALLDALPESKRWDPVPGSTGHQTPVPPSEDEDSAGRSVTEQLVDDGAWKDAHEKSSTD